MLVNEGIISAVDYEKLTVFNVLSPEIPSQCVTSACVCCEYWCSDTVCLTGLEESVLNTAESRTVRLLTIVDKQWAHTHLRR